jgi:PAS domain S-box-containing protein
MRLSALLPDLARLDTPALVEALREQSGESTAASLLLTRGDGSTLPVQVTASTAPALGDEMLLVSLRDVSAFQVVEQRLRSQVYQLSRLNAIGRRLAAKHSVEAILSEMLLEGQRLLEPTEALVLRIDPDHQRATAAWIMEGESNGVQDHQHLQRRFSKPCERFSRLLSSAEPTKVGAEDLNPLAEVEILPREWLQRRRRWITQTIVASDRPVALVIMGRDANSPWKDQGLSLLNNLATMAGLSLDNAEHLTSVERAHTRWRHLFDSSRDAIGVVDLSTGRVVAANREWSILTAQSLDDASDAPFVDVLAEADWEQAQERLARLQETGQERWECRLNVWGEGEGVWVQVRASLVESGATPTALLILINITAQRQRDQEVRSLSRIAIANPNLVLKADESGEIIYANPGTSAFLRRAGMPPDKVAATLPESLEGLVRPLVANPGKVETFEHRVGDRTLLHTATATEDERTVIFHGVEITAQKHLEEAITESEENYRLLVEGAREGICAIRDGVFHTVNRALCAMLGRDADEVVGKPLREFMEPEDWPEIRQILVDWPHGAPKVRESAFRLHDAMGRVRDIHGAFVPDKVGDTPQLLGYLTDITEQRRLESQLLQKHRIESVGQLAKGIANEFNNSLCTILGNASQMAERLSGDAEAQRLLSAIERAADRGADLTHQLQTFTNSAQVDPQILDLSEEIKRCIDLVRGTIGADVRISFTPTAEPALVEIDPAQLNQVLVAIAANSREAMPRGGELQIRVCSFVLGTPEIERMPQGRMGPHHCLEVSDTGGGIPEDVLPKIFDPFFTTKSSGDGTGLGLALVHTIMERMGGFIDVESEVGVGTTMRLFMPRSDGSTEKSASSEGAVRSCGSLVLIVDDEDLVRELVAEVLQDAGFKVMTARNGAEGLAACEGLIDDLSAVVLDFIMPVMDGAETFKRLREIRPDLPILVASGFAGEQETGDMLSQGNADFLTKPFRREALLGKLDALIVARA